MSSAGADNVAPIYAKSAGGQLRQGEIISGLYQVLVSVTDRRSPEGQFSAEQMDIPLAVVLSQDCDLETAYRQHGDRPDPEKLPNVLFGEILSAPEVNDDVKSSRLWATIKGNKNERYHFLERVPSEDDSLGSGLGELTIDFKRYFTLPILEVHHQLAQDAARRRCRLVSPYLEHLSTRFSYYQSRVALPHDHASESAAG